MFQTLTAVPFVEPLKQQRLELECVVGRRIGHAHQLGEDEEHEEVVLFTSSPGYRTTIGRDIELFEQRLQPGETTLFLSHRVSSPRPRRPRRLGAHA